MTFPAYRLPPEIELGAQGGPAFQTVIQEAISGREQRVRTWAKARARYDIGYSILDATDADGAFRAVQHMFYAHFGKLHPFRFKDWGDYQATDENFGTGDGTTTAFQLKKTYDPQLILLGSSGTRTYTREIYILSDSPAPIIKKAGVTQTLTTDYTISATGLVTFTSAPANGAALTWTGDFDIPVRFDIDELPSIIEAAHLGRYQGIMLREVIGADELA